jgi:hypothetical protein
VCMCVIQYVCMYMCAKAFEGLVSFVRTCTYQGTLGGDICVCVWCIHVRRRSVAPHDKRSMYVCICMRRYLKALYHLLDQAYMHVCIYMYIMLLKMFTLYDTGR